MECGEPSSSYDEILDVKYEINDNVFKSPEKPSTIPEVIDPLKNVISPKLSPCVVKITTPNKQILQKEQKSMLSPVSSHVVIRSCNDTVDTNKKDKVITISRKILGSGQNVMLSPVSPCRVIIDHRCLTPGSANRQSKVQNSQDMKLQKSPSIRRASLSTNDENDLVLPSPDSAKRFKPKRHSSIDGELETQLSLLKKTNDTTKVMRNAIHMSERVSQSIASKGAINLIGDDIESRGEPKNQAVSSVCQ